MKKTTELFRILDRHHVLQALLKLDEGATSRFADSVKFDLVHQGKRYPPKEVAGLALENMTREDFGPMDFSGGEKSACFKSLERCGFKIIHKRPDEDLTLTDVIHEILDLQTKYNSANTPDMQRRGVLIRDSLPYKIEENYQLIEPIFTKVGYQCEIAGSDGKGRKNESPWVRIYDQEMSPSATMGWYVVMHFARNGQTAYLALGCGATVFKDGSLIKVPPEDLERQVIWAKKTLTQQGVKFDQYTDMMQLGGNALSMQFEKACALVKAYNRSNFNERVFWTDLRAMSQALTVLYEQERTGKSPVSEHPDLITARELMDEISRPTKRSGKGQGRGLTHPERRSVEMRAMQVAQETLEKQGFESIVDTSKTESYDFSAMRDGEKWLVEVKGTTSTNGDAFLLTASELTLHQKNVGKTVLVIVTDIELDGVKEEPMATGGRPEAFIPWYPDSWTFEPISYQAKKR